MNNIRTPLTLSLSPRERWGEGCFGHLNLELGYYLGFGFWDLEFCGRANNNGGKDIEETSMVEKKNSSASGSPQGEIDSG